MYCRINKNYAIRGWDRLPYAMVELTSGNVWFMNEIQFQALSFCNGSVDIESSILLKQHKEVIHDLLKQNVVEECEQGDTLSEYQNYRLVPCRHVRKAHWSITGRCNMRCRHCYMSAPQAKFGELSTETCLDIIDQMEQANICEVSFTGGEPLVRKDFWQLTDALLLKQICISQIYTNGMLVNQDFLDKLASRGMNPDFALSFDGIGWHDWIRGIPGAEENVIEKIKLLKENNRNVTVEMTLHKNNIHTLFDSVMLLAGLGVSYIKASPTTDSGNWCNEESNLTLGIEETYEAYLNFIGKYKAAGAPVTVQLSGFFYCEKGSDEFHSLYKRFNGSSKVQSMPACGCARNMLYIAANGKVLPCISLSGMEMEKNLQKLSAVPLVQQLSGSDYLELIDIRVDGILKHNSACSSCGHKLYCGGGCRAGALLCNNGYSGIDESACVFFKQGYEEKINRVWQHND